MHLVVHALIHRGLQRPGNEDALAVGDWIAANELERPKRIACELDRPLPVLVADGMGGHAAGDVASRIALQTALARAGAVADAGGGAALLQACNRAVYAAMERGEGAPGMGTTLAGLVLRPEAADGAGAVWFNCGDSKLYCRAPARDLVQLSVDDTPGPKLADGRTAAQTTPMLSQALGGQPVLTEIEPHAEAAPAAPGTRWLLCTDGLSDLVGVAEIADLLADGAEDGGDAAADNADATAVATLFREVMERGGKDNVAIALVRLSGPAGPPNGPDAGERVLS